MRKFLKKSWERRLQWYSHARRKESEYAARRAMEMEVPGRKGRGIPKQRWMDNVRKDMRDKHLSDDDVHELDGGELSETSTPHRSEIKM